MTLAASGAISLGGLTVTRSVNLELGVSGTAAITMNDTGVRVLAEKTTTRSPISMLDFYNKSKNSSTVPLSVSWDGGSGVPSPTTSGLVGAGGGWSITNSGRTIQFTVENSANCGGPNGNRQRGYARAVITGGSSGYRFIPSMVGFGERQDTGFDQMTLYFNGSLIVTGDAPGGGLGCATAGPVVQTPSSIPFQTIAPGSSNTFECYFDTVDGLYHVDAYYILQLAFYLL
jgi:hypothetical protein